MIYERIPFSLISLLNSDKLISPNTKKSAITASCHCNESISKAAYKAPDKALMNSSFTGLVYKSSSSSKYKFFELLP